MDGSGSSRFQRRVLVVAVVFGLFALFDLALFGWLILDTLSRREIDRALLSTREDAIDVADQLARTALERNRDLLTVIATEEETMTYLENELAQQELVEEIQVVNEDGIVVYSTRTETVVPNVDLTAEEIVLGGGELPPARDSVTETRRIETPIGDIGFLRVGLDPIVLQKRVTVLREELLRQAVTIGAVTVLLLLTAIVVMWLLLRRAQRLETQAAESERLAYIGSLAAGLAHEIRNPLNSLNLNMQMLQEDLGERRGAEGDASSERLLKITRSELDRLGGLVTDFLSYARPAEPELEEVPAAGLLNEAAEVLAGEIDAQGVAVEIEDLSEGARVRVDPAQLKQLLLNLLRNALDALDPAEGGEARVRLASSRRGPRVVLEVEDNGVGMGEEQRRRMFELFYSTRKGGTGLGLAIVERIARGHGGTLEVDSAPGEGTRIRLLLPAATAAAQPEAAEMMASNSSSEANSSSTSLPQVSQKASVTTPSS